MSESTALLLDQSKTQKASENLVSAKSHMIRVGLPSQSEPQKHNPEKKAHKPLHTSCISQEMYLPCLIIIQSCYFDYRIYKPFTCSRCVICVLCSIHLISAYAKDHGLFYLNYPQITEVRKSDHMEITVRPPTNHFLTTYLPTTYRPLTDHLPATYRPLTDHLLTTYLPTTYQPLTDHLPTTYQPLTDHLLTTY